MKRLRLWRRFAGMEIGRRNENLGMNCVASLCRSVGSGGIIKAAAAEKGSSKISWRNIQGSHSVEGCPRRLSELPSGDCYGVREDGCVWSAPRLLSEPSQSSTPSIMHHACERFCSEMHGLLIHSMIFLHLLGKKERESKDAILKSDSSEGFFKTLFWNCKGSRFHRR